MFSTIGFDTAVGTTADKVLTAGGIWLFINIGLGIVALIAGSTEKSNYKRKGVTLPQVRYSRAGLKVLSSWLLIMCVLLGSTFFTSVGLEKYVGLMMIGIFGTWAIISYLYAHCPKQYSKIQFTTKAKPIRRLNLALMGIFISWVFFIAYIVIAIIYGTPQ